LYLECAISVLLVKQIGRPMIGYYLYLTFIVSFFLHLPARIPVLGVIRFDLTLAGATLAYALMYGQENIREKGNISITIKAIHVLLGYIIISLPFVEWPGSVIRFAVYSYIKVIVFFFFTIWYIDSTKRLKTLLWLFLLCQVFRVIEPVFLHVTEGYWGSSAFIQDGQSLDRLSGSPYDIVNPNQLAWVIVTTWAFLYYCVWEKTWTRKLIFLGLSAIFLYALLLTGSRSGLLSLAMLIVAILFLGKNRLKRIIVFSMFLIPLTIVISGHLGSDLSDRYRSIFDSSAPGAGTMQGRIRGLKAAFTILSDRPIFGHGLGTSLETNFNLFGGRGQISHNLYIEILQELGVVGFVIFSMYVKAIISSLIHAKKTLSGLSTSHSWLMKPVMATQVWIAMHLFYSLSCFGLSSWEWYLFGGVSTVCLKLAKESAQNEGVTENLDL